MKIIEYIRSMLSSSADVDQGLAQDDLGTRPEELERLVHKDRDDVTVNYQPPIDEDMGLNEGESVVIVDKEGQARAAKGDDAGADADGGPSNAS